MALSRTLAPGQKAGHQRGACSPVRPGLVETPYFEDTRQDLHRVGSCGGGGGGASSFGRIAGDGSGQWSAAGLTSFDVLWQPKRWSEG